MKFLHFWFHLHPIKVFVSPFVFFSSKVLVKFYLTVSLKVWGSPFEWHRCSSREFGLRSNGKIQGVVRWKSGLSEYRHSLELCVFKGFNLFPSTKRGTSLFRVRSS
ncbi:hypothetical protein V6N11_020982 [Hibiscus sabdariffa]|uniref:Uncharacterized protein n=2 Tax=Hibiscus sabdariffa TaxID=183260 RepID=A0ABR1ZHU7_9ROSI